MGVKAGARRHQLTEVRGGTIHADRIGGEAALEPRRSNLEEGSDFVGIMR